MKGKILVSELIGTFALVFIGAGTVAVGNGVVAAALAHGLVVVAFAYAYGSYSGTHINPAVSFGMWVGKQISLKQLLGYWIAQCSGGILAAGALFALLGEGPLGQTVLAEKISPIQGFAIESILTFFLVNTVFNTAVSGKGGQMSGLAIGLTLTFSILMGGTLTGASLNPARTLGPAIASGEFANLWVYFAGPLLGGGLAGLLYSHFFKGDS